MTTVVTILTTVVIALGTVTPALAQGRGRDVLEIVIDMTGLNRTVRGHVVKHREGLLVLRGEDERTYTVNTVSLGAAAYSQLKAGRPVAVTVKNGTPGGMPIAVSVEAGQGPEKLFRRVDGTIESVNRDQVAFRTREGMTLTLDRSRIVGSMPGLMPSEPATLFYEQEPQLVAVWIDTREVQPSAAVPSAAYQRVHGYVQAVGRGTLTLKADDGRTLTVDTTQVTAPPPLRAGDLVSVVGKAARDERDRFVAEMLQPDGVAAPSPR